MALSTHLTTTAAATASSYAYVPVVGIGLFQQPAPLQPVIPQPTAAILPQPAPPGALWMYNQPSVALAAAPASAILTTTPHHVVHTVDPAAAANPATPIRFYYKTNEGLSNEEQLLTKSADSLSRRHSSRRYDSSGNRVRRNNSKLADSINSADVAARQLQRLSANMAQSVYSHLNSAPLS